MMKKNPKVNLKFLHHLSEELFFQLSDQECKNLLLDFESIENQMQLVRNISTQNVLPLDFPFDVKRNFLRNDIIEPVLTTEEVLSVAAQVKDNYIVINKVINNEKN